MKPHELGFEQEYTFQIRHAIRRTSNPCQARRVRHRCPHQRGSRSGLSAERLFGSARSRTSSLEPLFENSSSWLNPRLTFDSYVVGSCNQLAHAAAMAVAKMPLAQLQPAVYVRGRGHRQDPSDARDRRSLLDNFVGMNVVYTSSERFMNEMITCLKIDRMTQFHRHYRSADALADRRHPRSRGQRAHAGRVLSHFQRSVRTPEADCCIK